MACDCDFVCMSLILTPMPNPPPPPWHPNAENIDGLLLQIVAHAEPRWILKPVVRMDQEFLPQSRLHVIQMQQKKKKRKKGKSFLGQ